MANQRGNTDPLSATGDDIPGGGQSRANSRGVSIAIGLVSTAIAVTAGQLLAALAGWVRLTSGTVTPFGALGNTFISVTPAWLKQFGISAFGSHDKLALAVSMLATFVLAGIIIGALSRVSPPMSLGFAALLVAATCVAIATRPEAGVADVVMMALGGTVALIFLAAAIRISWRAPAGQAPAPIPSAPNAWTKDKSDPAYDVPPRQQAHTVARRRALRMAGLGALGALVGGIVARLIPDAVDVRANRAAVVLPPATGHETGSHTPTKSTPNTAKAPQPPAVRAHAEGIVIPPAIPPDANPDIDGLSPFVTPQENFYRVDTAFVLPRVTTDAWRLRVHGMVQNPFEIGWSELTSMPQIKRWITLTCVSNRVGGDLVGNASWQGARIADLLARAQPSSDADCVLSTSADKFTVTTPLDALTDGRDALLAIGMDDQPLPVEHGFPVRMVVPGLYGYVSATKWVVDLEVTTFSKATAFWTRNGWSAGGPIKTASRIDTPHQEVSVGPGIVPVAGVAWAQHRGISAVDIQVDDGDWQPAHLGGTASADTWVQWVYRWDTSTVAAGRHTLRCRATDGTGAMQIAVHRPPVPNGSSGYHTIEVVTG